jgi:hypothetical protein
VIVAAASAMAPAYSSPTVSSVTRNPAVIAGTARRTTSRDESVSTTSAIWS